MTVAELIAKLQQLPQDMSVLLSWEGTLLPPKTVEVTNCHQCGGPDASVWVDYSDPEFCDPDEDEVRFQAVLID